MTTPNLITICIVLLVLGIRILRSRHPRPLRINRLWIAPVLAGSGIGLGLWFQPHVAFTVVDYLIFVAAMAAGAGVGMVRARSFKLTRDPETGQLMMQQHILAVLLIIGLVAGRSAVRNWAMQSGNAAAAGSIIDALMLFALALIVTQQAVTWRRAREVPPLLIG